jgi:hypothetical protein
MTPQQTHRQRIEDIRRRRAAMALRCSGALAGLANERWADVGYLLNALEHAERIVDELVACPPIVVELPRDLADEQAMVRELERIRDAGGTVRVLRCRRDCTCPTLLDGHHAGCPAA